MNTAEIIQRLKQYAEINERVLFEQLRGGTDGEVWSTKVSTVLKSFELWKTYHNEVSCYLRLKDRGLKEIFGFSIPSLEGWDDELMVIEMSIVSPPYILDFGKAYLDRPHGFPPSVMAEWVAEQQERWGTTWPLIRSILGKLQSVGIYHMDPKPGNILPKDWNPPD